MKGNVKNGDRNKKEKMENFAEFVRKNREKQKKEKLLDMYMVLIH